MVGLVAVVVGSVFGGVVDLSIVGFSWSFGKIRVSFGFVLFWGVGFLWLILVG